MQFLENWSSSALLKDIWKIKGIMDESDSYEHYSVELSDDEQESSKNTLSHDKTSENEDDDEDEDESCESDSSEVCGTLSSNKFAALDVSD